MSAELKYETFLCPDKKNYVLFWIKYDGLLKIDRIKLLNWMNSSNPDFSTLFFFIILFVYFPVIFFLTHTKRAKHRLSTPFPSTLYDI